MVKKKPHKKELEIKRGKMYFYFEWNLLLHLKVVENKINLRYLLYKFYSCCKYVFYFISFHFNDKGKRELKRVWFILLMRP